MTDYVFNAYSTRDIGLWLARHHQNLVVVDIGAQQNFFFSHNTAL